MRTMTRMEKLALASRAYRSEKGAWPDDARALKADPHWRNLETNDAWAHPFSYFPYNPALGFGVITTLGADGRRGGTGRDADGFFFFTASNTPSAELQSMLQKWRETVGP